MRVCIHTFFQSVCGNYLIACFYLLWQGVHTFFKGFMQSNYAYTGVSLHAFQEKVCIRIEGPAQQKHYIIYLNMDGKMKNELILV